MQTISNNIVVLIVIVTLLLLLLFFFIVNMIFSYQKKQMTYLQKIETLRTEYEKTLLNTQIEIQDQTFQDISREIHDNISLSLTLAKLNLNTILIKNELQAQNKIKSSTEFLSKALNDLSNILRRLNSEIIVERGLISALEQEIESINKLNLLKAQVTISGDPIYMDAQKDLFIFRIVQESLNNILKHAKATYLSVNLIYYTDKVNIEVSDDGIGFLISGDADKKVYANSLGLRNIQKRVELLNGTLKIKSYPGEGTSIFISIPVIRQTSTNDKSCPG